MVGGVSSAANQLFGALAAVANPRSMVGVQAASEAKRLGKVAPAEESQAPGGKSELTEEEKQEVQKLKERDAEVRRHEQAHKAAAGGHARGGPSFEFETGPDGNRYAVGGEVSIDTSAVKGDAQATIAKMQKIRQAALSPAEPSGQDRKVAAQAAQAESKARAELAEEKREGPEGTSGESAATGPTGQHQPFEIVTTAQVNGQASTPNQATSLDRDSLGGNPSRAVDAGKAASAIEREASVPHPSAALKHGAPISKSRPSASPRSTPLGAAQLSLAQSFATTDSVQSAGRFIDVRV